MNRKSTQYLLLAFLFLLSSFPLLKAQGPTCTIWSPDGNVSSRPDSVPFRVSFSKVVTGFQPSDVLVFGGLILGMTPTTPDSSYTVYVRADSCLIMTMQIFAGAAQDSLGNQSQGAQLFTLRYDTCSPKVIFTPHYGNPTGANPIPVDIDFKERVTGFTTSDILLANATLSGAPVNYQNLDSLFTIQIVPTGPGLTIISLSLDSAAVTDVAQLVNDSTGITIVYDPTLASISQYQDDPKVKLYPNPGNGIFNVFDADNAFSSWELYDVEGKKTKSGNLNFGGMIDAASFSEGKYLLVLYGDQKVITRKLIIQK
jgi:hypothetical protein